MPPTSLGPGRLLRQPGAWPSRRRPGPGSRPRLTPLLPRGPGPLPRQARRRKFSEVFSVSARSRPGASQTYSKTCSEVQIFMVPPACSVLGRRGGTTRHRGTRAPPHTRPAAQRAGAVRRREDVPTRGPAPYPGPARRRSSAAQPSPASRARRNSGKSRPFASAAQRAGADLVARSRRPAPCCAGAVLRRRGARRRSALRCAGCVGLRGLRKRRAGFVECVQKGFRGVAFEYSSQKVASASCLNSGNGGAEGSQPND